MESTKILCPVDFSDHSFKALARACEAAEHSGAKLYILHVEGVRNLAIPGTVGYIPELDEYKRLLEETTPDSPNILYEQHYTRGDVAEEIIRFAKLREIDRIIMGTHGRTGLLRSLMGSVASSVSRMATCHVETIRPSTVDSATQQSKSA